MFFDPGTYERGVRYFREGRVRELREEQGLITAFVEGTQPAPYLVAIDPAAPERHTCSCPVSYSCKHVVAVISAILDGRLPDSPAASSLIRVLDAAEAAVPGAGRTRGGARAGSRGPRTASSASTRKASPAPGAATDWDTDSDDAIEPLTIDLARSVQTARRRSRPNADGPPEQRIRLVADEDEAEYRLAYLVVPVPRRGLDLFAVRQARRRDGTYGRLQRLRPGDPLFATAELSAVGARIERFGGTVPFVAVARELCDSGAPLFIGRGAEPSGAQRHPVRRIEPDVLTVELTPRPDSVSPRSRPTGGSVMLTARLTLNCGGERVEPAADAEAWHSVTDDTRVVLFADGTLVLTGPGDPIGRALALAAGRLRLAAADVAALDSLAVPDRLIVRYPRRINVVTAEEAPVFVLETDAFGITGHLEGSTGEHISGWHGDEYTLVTTEGFDLYDAISRVERVLGRPRAGARFDEPVWRIASDATSIRSATITRMARELGRLDIGVAVRDRNGVLRPLRHARAMSVSVTSDIDWFKVDVSIDGSIRLDYELLEQLAAGDAITAGGEFILLDEEERERLARILELVSDRAGRLGRVDLGTIEEIVGFADEADAPTREVAELARALLAGEAGRRREAPRGLCAELRDYQLAGLSRLALLAEYDLGACLADDMGLGKTVQALAFLLDLREREAVSGSDAGQAARYGTLVVAPVSTLENWRREAARFTPELRVLLMHGPDRPTDEESLAGADLVLTSYATATRTIDLLRAREWLLVCLDEAQAIKNPHAKTTRALKRLAAAHRLCLTGTPIENHTVDLWSILDFAVPGLLGPLGSFTNRFPKRLTDSDRSRRAIERLERIVAPFVLRRTKESVAPELPPKIEMTLRCEMGPKQASFYHTLREYHHARLQAAIETRDRAEIGAALFTGLLRLRQAALYPAVADPAGESVPSIKESELRASLLEVVEGGHKAIVFSQFVSALDRFRDMARRAGIDSLYLDGQTKHRAELIDSFQDPAGPPVFFISLKAGGTGINLTAADYVFVCDPWWNPQVERQAVDRAHRIGRTRPVVVTRLIAAGSVEEKVALLQERKRALAETLVREQTGRLSLEAATELLELFEEDR